MKSGDHFRFLIVLYTLIKLLELQTFEDGIDQYTDEVDQGLV